MGIVMTNNRTHGTNVANTTHRTLTIAILATGLGLILLTTSASAQGRYVQKNLVSDIPGLASLTDPSLINAWGVSCSTASPFWVSANGTGKATLYAVTNDAQGIVHVTKQALEVNIPGEGSPTGQLFDGSGKFHGDIFVFASEDGIISGWRPSLG